MFWKIILIKYFLLEELMRVPKHIAIIPDGNRRWAVDKGLNKEDGYNKGLHPGVEVLRLARDNGVEEITYYGFTTDNCKRPKIQVESFVRACIDAVDLIAREDVSLLVVGNDKSKFFPEKLKKYRKRTNIEKGGIKVNFLVNYGWEWDVSNILGCNNRKVIIDSLESKDISRIDLVIRWGGRRRLSGLLPIQTVYSDFFVIDDMWPDFKEAHFYDALRWYDKQDVTLGG